MVPVDLALILLLVFGAINSALEATARTSFHAADVTARDDEPAIRIEKERPVLWLC